jgi:hypothetical protein
MPPSSPASKSNRIWPLIASIFWPDNCTAIRPPSDTTRSSLSGCFTQPSFSRSDSSARKISFEEILFSRSLIRVWKAIRSENV